MARKQYRIYTPSSWITYFGNAYLAITNVSGSGRKITIRSIEAQVLSTTGFNPGSTWTNTTLNRYAAPLPVGGEDMAAYASRADDSVAIPATVIVKRGGNVGTSTGTIRRFDPSRRAAGIATVRDPRFVQHQFGPRRMQGLSRFGLVGSPIKNTNTEAMFLRQNEAIAAVTDTTEAPGTTPVRVSVTLSIDGKTANWDFVSQVIAGSVLFSVENTGTSVVKLLHLAVTELGTNDTPTISVVPIGQIRTADLTDPTKELLTAAPMDSVDGALSTSVCRIFADVNFQPFGVPEVYLSAGSAGVPKAMNYLHTKDFNGPTFRNFLPEVNIVSDERNPDDRGLINHRHKNMDLLMRRKAACPAAPIVVNPGEGVALVGSAETAAGGASASYSGWPGLMFSLTFDVEPQFSPTLSLTGLQNPTEVRIFDAGTQTLLAGQENVTGGVFSWQYDVDDVSAVDIAILSLGYQNIRITNFTLPTSGDSSVPIQQQIDRQYLNP